MVEQDLVICRALVDIFNHPALRDNLAFRGGKPRHLPYFHPRDRGQLSGSKEGWTGGPAGRGRTKGSPRFSNEILEISR
jgi:hypothetical protein